MFKYFLLRNAMHKRELLPSQDVRLFVTRWYCVETAKHRLSINQSINEISIAPPTKSGRRRLTM